MQAFINQFYDPQGTCKKYFPYLKLLFFVLSVDYVLLHNFESSAMNPTLST